MPTPTRKSFIRYPCRRCLRRPAMFPDAPLCGRCFARSVVTLLGLLFMVGGYTYALWAFASLGR